MKAKLIYIIITALLIISCEENFSPVGEFNQEYSINCIINSDSSNHVAVIKSSYPVTNDSMVTDVSGAIITITGPRDVYTFEENYSAGSGYPSVIYSLENWKPRWEQEYIFKAELATGEVFTSTILLKDTLKFNTYYSDTVFPPQDEKKDAVTAIWRRMSPEVLAERKAYISYYREENNELVEYLQPVPIRLVEVNGKEEPVYTDFSNASTFSFPMKAVDMAMSEIWDGESPRNSYYIGWLYYYVTIFDKQLASYMLTSTNVDGDFSASQHLNVYSSFEDAYGVVGFKISGKLPCIFEPEYVYSFGYVTVYYDWFDVP
jgi:hypothetical protein